MTTLNKVYGVDNVWYETDNYRLESTENVNGYYIVNKETGQAEAQTDQFPQAVVSLQQLQEVYDDVMEDPERYFKVQKQKREAAVAAGGQGLIRQ